MPWVQLLRGQVFEKAGKARQYHPGDWIEIGKQTAQRLVIDGAARFASAEASKVSLDGCGALLIGNGFVDPDMGVSVSSAKAPTQTSLSLPYARTLILSSMKIRPELLSVGFGSLDTWEVVCPLFNYDTLAIHVGGAADKARTEAVIHDLRVPLYESRMVFVKRCRAGEALVEAWKAELAEGGDERLAFLRALYQVKPLICAVPLTWHKAA